MTTVGKATQKANAHAFNHIDTMLCTHPTLKILITRDIKHDINKAIKNAKTMGAYFLGIMANILF